MEMSYDFFIFFTLQLLCQLTRVNQKLHVLISKLVSLIQKLYAIIGKLISLNNCKLKN